MVISLTTENDFQLLPSDGRPSRIIRFVDGKGVDLDVLNNVLTIGRDLWDTLTKDQRQLLERVTPQEVKRWR